MDPRLQGLIYGLTQQRGMNVVDAGLVVITANYYSPNRCYPYNAKNPKYVFEYESNLGYCDNNTRNSWIKFDFKDRKYNINKYTIQFGYKVVGHYQKWLLEGSNDDIIWTVIDNRLSETKRHVDFEIDQYVSQNDTFTEFRYVRLFVIGFWASDSYISLTSIEFFTDTEYPSDVVPLELPHKFSFITPMGKYVNDSLGVAILEGDNFTGTLNRGIYTFSAWSYSATTFVEGVLRIYSPKQCTIEAPSTTGYNTTVSIDSELIINAPYYNQIIPFVHNSLTKTHYVRNYFYNYSNFLVMYKNQKGRVVVAYSPFLKTAANDPYNMRIRIAYTSLFISLLK